MLTKLVRERGGRSEDHEIRMPISGYHKVDNNESPDDRLCTNIWPRRGCVQTGTPGYK